MKKLIAALLVALPFVAGSAFAEDKKEMTPQQKKMAECSTKAKGLKGDEYKKAHADCLAGDAKADAKADAPKMTQQEKMKACAEKNKGMKGDEYKKAQSECLKG
jgi:hypothetical protein